MASKEERKNKRRSVVFFVCVCVCVFFSGWKIRNKNVDGFTRPVSPIVKNKKQNKIFFLIFSSFFLKIFDRKRSGNFGFNERSLPRRHCGRFLFFFSPKKSPFLKTKSVSWNGVTKMTWNKKKILPFFLQVFPK